MPFRGFTTKWRTAKGFASLKNISSPPTNNRLLKRVRFHLYEILFYIFLPTKGEKLNLLFPNTAADLCISQIIYPSKNSLSKYNNSLIYYD